MQIIHAVGWKQSKASYNKQSEYISYPDHGQLQDAMCYHTTSNVQSTYGKAPLTLCLMKLQMEMAL